MREYQHVHLSARQGSGCCPSGAHVIPAAVDVADRTTADHAGVRALVVVSRRLLLHGRSVDLRQVVGGLTGSRTLVPAGAGHGDDWLSGRTEADAGYVGVGRVSARTRGRTPTAGG